MVHHATDQLPTERTDVSQPVAAESSDSADNHLNTSKNYCLSSLITLLGSNQLLFSRWTKILYVAFHCLILNRVYSYPNIDEDSI